MTHTSNSSSSSSGTSDAGTDVHRGVHDISSTTAAAVSITHDVSADLQDIVRTVQNADDGSRAEDGSSQDTQTLKYPMQELCHARVALLSSAAAATATLGK